VEAELRRLKETSDIRIPGKRAQAKEQNRRVILDAARRVFAEFGYGATTVRDIIRATPLASGTFYNYFRSKEEVFQALRDETALAVRPALREARLKTETPEAFVSAVFQTFFAHVAANPADALAITRKHAMHVRVDTPEIVAGFEELREDIEAAIARGLLPPTDPEFLTAAMVGVAFEMAKAMQKRAPANAEAAARFATALFLGGIAALPKQGNGHAPSTH